MKSGVKKSLRAGLIGRRFLCLTACGFFSVISLVRSQQAPRAVPVPESEESSVPRAVPVQPGGAAPRAAVVEDRPAPPKPTGPDEDLFDYASLLYERKEHALAAQSFGQYLQRFPTGRHVPLCLFRLGESYVNLNQVADSEKYYLEVVNRYPSSEGAPSAAYRLGAMRYNEAIQAPTDSNLAKEKYLSSAKNFAFCEARTPFLPVKLAAIYNKSRAYQGLGDRKNMMIALRSVADIKTENPYRESALLSLATALLSEDKKDEALKMFLSLLEASKDPLILSDSLVKAGVLEAETGKPDDAIKHFEEALKLTQTSPENRGVALVGTVQALFFKEDYNAVIDIYNRNSSVLPPGDLRPKMLLLVGHAHRLRKNYARAVDVYLLIEQYHPQTDQAYEAGYWKLYCFYLLGEKDLPEFAQQFLDRHEKKRSDHEFVNLARLILADSYFNKQQYQEAAEAFVNVRFSSLPEKLVPDSLFNKGWAEAESGRHQDAINTFSSFITAHPKHASMGKALARRGLSYREVRDLPKAQTDFRRVTKDFESSDAAELSYLQLGLIHTELREVKEMIEVFEEMVKKFPDSKAIAQAHYGIGRGYFELKSFDKAIDALRKAVATDKETYLDKASPMIVLSFYAKQDADALAKAIDEYRNANPKATNPPNVLGWLGISLFNKKDYARSARFLTYTTEEDPAGATPAIWDHLGRAWLELKNWDYAIKALDNVLANPPDVGSKARALLSKSRALLGAEKFVEADAIVKEGLEIVKDGKLQAQFLILSGDVFYAEGEALDRQGQKDMAVSKWMESAGKYVVPSQMFVDPEITPEALYKAARALNRAGQKEKAEDLLQQLEKRYPTYKPTVAQ